MRIDWRSPRLLVVLLFAVSRLLARGVFGLRFDAATLDYWQVLDPQLLRTDLLRSVLFQHGQPPLFNIFLGVVLKAAGEHAPLAFDAVFLALGLALLLAIHALLRELGVPTPAALAATAVQAFSTTLLVYESWLFNTLPTAVLLAWAAVWLARAARGRRRAVLAFAAAVAAVSLLRSTYHLVWTVCALTLLLVAVPAARRRVAALAALLALAPVVGLYAKNAVLVGSFSSSSWMGMNFARMTTDRLDAATRERWSATGELPAAAREPAFSPLDRYPAPLRSAPPGTPAHPALTAPVKSDGSENFNHAAYAAIAREDMRGALRVIARRPRVYLSAVREAWLTWLRPPTDYEFVEAQRQALGRWDALHSRLVLWSRPGPRGDGPSWMIAAAGLLVALALAATPAGERRRRLLLLAFPLLAIAVNAVAGNLAEVEENNRFRVEVEPLVWALGVWAAADLARRARKRPLPAGPTGRGLGGPRPTQPDADP